MPTHERFYWRRIFEFMDALLIDNERSRKETEYESCSIFLTQETIDCRDRVIDVAI